MFKIIFFTEEKQEHILRESEQQKEQNAILTEMKVRKRAANAARQS